MNKSEHNKFNSIIKIPPLINLQKIERHNIDKKLIIVYLRDEIFISDIILLANNNINLTFIVFTNCKKIIQHSNIKYYKCSNMFKEYLQKCRCVISTPGTAIIIECVYNDIPLILFDNHDLEQHKNFKNYTEKLKWAYPFNLNIYIEKLLLKYKPVDKSVKEYFESTEKEVKKLFLI